MCHAVRSAQCEVRSVKVQVEGQYEMYSVQCAVCSVQCPACHRGRFSTKNQLLLMCNALILPFSKKRNFDDFILL